MLNNQIKNDFLGHLNKWVCDNYSASIRFIAGINDNNLYIWEASIILSPLPADTDNSFTVRSDKILLGQIDIKSASEREFVEIIENAINGVIETPQGRIILEKEKETEYRYYSESTHRDLWYYQLHLSINGRGNQAINNNELAEIDNSLRLSSPPFDGLKDASSWLGLNGNKTDNRDATISININPPVDLIFDKSSLNNDILKLVLHAHPKFDTKLLKVAVRAIPGDNLNTRLQVASNIKWVKDDGSRIRGEASIKVKNSDNIIIMLMIGGSIVRRQWILDQDKARNNRLLAVQSFDKNLKMIKHAVLETPDSSKFENGISALLFLLGFSPCVQIETDSPDLIVQTPSGRLILVECTLRISDFATKIGKLVDRRGSLIKELEKSGHSTSVTSIIVCRLPKDQIAAKTDDLVALNTILITEEMLKDSFNEVRYNNDPDSILEKAESELLRNQIVPLN